MAFPCSGYDLTGGIVYFARMCDKIRLHATGSLPEGYHANLGAGSDARLCAFLRVDYAELRNQVLAGASDEEALEWCYAQGHRLTEVDVLICNGFFKKRGWRDEPAVMGMLEKFKAESGLGHRNDLVTFFDFFEADEGRE